jgi:hypothetical protein
MRCFRSLNVPKGQLVHHLLTNHKESSLSGVTTDGGEKRSTKYTQFAFLYVDKYQEVQVMQENELKLTVL